MSVKWIASNRTLELTARNIAALSDKLSDSLSARALVSPCGQIMAQAVENSEVTAGSVDAAASEAVVLLTRTDLEILAAKAAVMMISDVKVVAVSDAQHYAHRAPGTVYMPTSKETR